MAEESTAGGSWGQRMWPAATFQFFFIASVAVLKPSVNALVLSRFQTGALPWLYLVASLMTAGLSAYGAVERRARLSPSAVALGGALTVLLLAAGVEADAPWVALLAWLFVEGLATQVSLSFWAVASEAFDAREGRRAFVWINGIGMSGAILGGLLAQALARGLGALSLLVAGGGLLLAAGVAIRFHRSFLPPSPLRAGTPTASLSEALGSPYTRLLGALVLAFAVVQQLTDFVFRQRAVEALAEAQMADYFASHQLWTGIFCVAFQLVAAEGMLRRLGILNFIALVPLTVGGLTLLALLVPTVTTAWTLKLFESAASWSLLPVALQLMYAPLPDESRDGTRRSIEGLLRKGGMGIAAVALLGVAHAVGASGVLVLTLVVCLGVGVVLWAMRRRYVEVVHARVGGVQPGAIAEVEQRLLVELLNSAVPERVVRAADLLWEAGVLTELQVRVLLANPHPGPQTRGAQLALALGLSTVGRPLEALALEGTKGPRETAIHALSRLNPGRAKVVLPQLLVHNDVGTMMAALGGMLRLPGPVDPRAQQLLEALLKRQATASAQERRELAKLLGLLGDGVLAPALSRLLEDADPQVRRLAVEAVGQGKYLELAPKLLRYLSWREDRRPARDALAQLGSAVVPLLKATLDDRHRPLTLRLQLPRVLRRIGTQEALDALLFSNGRDEPVLHYRVGSSLVRLKRDHPHLSYPSEQVLEALARRRETYLLLRTPYRDIRAALGDRALLTRVVQDRLDQALEMSFWLLSLLQPDEVLLRAHSHLVGEDPRRKAWALELLEVTLSPVQRALVWEAMEKHHRELPAGDEARAPTQVAALCQVDDGVMRACARHMGRKLGVWPEVMKEDDMSEVTLGRLVALEGVEVFAQSDVDDLAAVAEVARELSFRKGERIYAEGDPGDALYVIVEGAVEARREGELVFRMRAKESFGETSLFDGAPRVNETVAVQDTRCLVIDRRDFLDLLGDRPELLAGMFSVLSRQLKSVVVAMSGRRASVEVPALPLPAPASTPPNPPEHEPAGGLS